MLGHPVVIGIIAVVAVIGALSFVPLPNSYNVSVSVTASDLAVVIGNIFAITSVTGSTAGAATIIDWGAALGTAWFTVQATFTMTVCVGGSHCTSKTQSSWFPSVPILGGGAITSTNIFTVGYVPSGSQTLSATLTQNGQVVATGSGSVCVNGGC